MTGVYTEDTLKALNKTQLIDLFLKMQDQTNSTIVSLMAEMKELRISFKRLESDVQIVKTVNNNLLKQLENTERHWWANAEYSRRECVEVIGIPKTVESKDLEHTICKVFNSIDFEWMNESFIYPRKEENLHIYKNEKSLNRA